MTKLVARTGRLVSLSLLIAVLLNGTARFAPANGAALRASHSLITTLPSYAAADATRSGKAAQYLCNQYNNSPLRFEAAAPQASAPACFIARHGAHSILLTASEARVALCASDAAGDAGSRPRDLSPGKIEPQVICAGWRLVGANRRARMSGENQLPTRTNYIIGKDAARWQTGIANYARVKVEQVYRGIDLVYYGAGQQLEYDFNVAAGADFKAIRWRFSGARRLSVDAAGDLVIDTPAGAVRQAKPVAYQFVAGSRREVSARYAVSRKREARFLLGEYDKRLPLVIDPVLSYSTYFGGRDLDSIQGMAVDASGDVYITGSTYSFDLPLKNALLPAHVPIYSDAFIAKLKASGTELIYSTYLGGSGADDGNAIAVDAAGNAYVTGTTYSTDFPTTAGAFQPAHASGRNSDAFVVKLSADGSAFSYSTYLGGDPEFIAFDYANSIAVDSFGNAYVTGLTFSSSFPTQSALQASKPRAALYSAFLAKLNSTGSTLSFSTYFGGSTATTEGSAVAVNAAGDLFVTGSTATPDLPVRSPAQASFSGQVDGFLFKLGAPRVTGASLAGKHLLIVGENFDQGATVLINGEPRRCCIIE